MNRSLRIYKILVCLLGICAIAGAVFLYFAQTVDYDLSIRHFAKDSPYAVAASLSVAAAAVVGVAAGFILKRKSIPVRFSKPSAFFIFTSSITAFMMLASFILAIRELSRGLPILEILRLVLLALSAAFFFLVSTREKKGDGFALLSLCPMLYALLSVLTVYFDTAYAMNSPLKSYYLLMYLSMALLFSAEARTAIRELQPFAYTFFGALCFVLSASIGLSQLAIALYDTVGHGFSVIDCALWIAISLFALSRLCSLTVGSEEETDGTDAAQITESNSNEAESDT